MNKKRMHDALDAALREELGECIVAVNGLSEDDLGRLAEAISMIDSEVEDAFRWFDPLPLRIVT